MRQLLAIFGAAAVVALVAAGFAGALSGSVPAPPAVPTSADQIQKVIERLTDLGFEVHRSTGAAQTVLGAVGAPVDFDVRDIEVLEGVQEAHRISAPYKLVGKSFRPEGTQVKLSNGVTVGTISEVPAVSFRPRFNPVRTAGATWKRSLRRSSGER